MHYSANPDSLNTTHENTRIKLGEQIFGSQREIDSIQKFGKPDEKMSSLEYWFASRCIAVSEHNSITEIKEKFKESMIHNFPKVLFIYMPLFAFVLWLFNNKKRWFYFDHGIFTLHYFSFLLLGCLIFRLFAAIKDLLAENIIINMIYVLLDLAICGYMFYYFFPAHHRFYGGTRTATILKGLCMLVLNSFFAGIIMLLFMIYTFINIK
ncbi:MAG: hypothetical protein EOO48_11895 [Flavobacterium sp.]|nr:MAG: hypothetical protein EOO48_11895 [Flavobacterium sp.]